MWIVAAALVGCTPTEDIDLGIDDVVSATCGDGRLDDGERCDAGPANGTTACGCTTSCRYPGATTTCDDGQGCTENDACDAAGGCAGEIRTCDDKDACTADTCDFETGTCAFTPRDLSPLALLADPEIRGTGVVPLTVHDHRVVDGVIDLDLYEVSFEAARVSGCDVAPAPVTGWLAVPVDAADHSPTAGVVVAPGFDEGPAEDATAVELALRLRAAVFAISNPGPITFSDPPESSWLWLNAANTVRALTALTSRPEIDAGRLGVVGTSGGGLTALLVNAADARVRAAMAIHATGYLDLAADTAPYPGWEVDLLSRQDPPLTPDGPTWRQWVDILDPQQYLDRQHGPVLIATGTQDQLFPIHSFAATAAALTAASDAHRFLALPNWDHGWFPFYDAAEPAQRTAGALASWFTHHLDLRAPDPTLPRPTLTAVEGAECRDLSVPYIGRCAIVRAAVDAPGWEVLGVTAWWSRDGLIWSSKALSPDAEGWSGEALAFDGAVDGPATLAFFVDAEIRSSALSPPVHISSAPTVPAGFSPSILPAPGPLPLP